MSTPFLVINGNRNFESHRVLFNLNAFCSWRHTARLYTRSYIHLKAVCCVFIPLNDSIVSSPHPASVLPMGTLETHTLGWIYLPWGPSINFVDYIEATVVVKCPFYLLKPRYPTSAKVFNRRIIFLHFRLLLSNNRNLRLHNKQWHWAFEYSTFTK